MISSLLLTHRKLLQSKAIARRALAPAPKHEPMSDIDTAVVDSLKVLDPKRPIREADIAASAILLEQISRHGTITRNSWNRTLRTVL